MSHVAFHLQLAKLLRWNLKGGVSKGFEGSVVSEIREYEARCSKMFQGSGQIRYCHWPTHGAGYIEKHQLVTWSLPLSSDKSCLFSILSGPGMMFIFLRMSGSTKPQLFQIPRCFYPRSGGACGSCWSLGSQMEHLCGDLWMFFEHLDGCKNLGHIPSPYFFFQVL